MCLPPHRVACSRLMEEVSKFFGTGRGATPDVHGLKGVNEQFVFYLPNNTSLPIVDALRYPIKDLASAVMFLMEKRGLTDFAALGEAEQDKLIDDATELIAEYGSK